MTVSISNKKLLQVKKLYYDKKYSMKMIADKLGVSIDAVTYFMRRNGLERRGYSENNKIVFDRKPLSFKIKKNLSNNDEILKAVGVSLYWGEGYKASKANGIDFANSDSDMIACFLKFLRRICRVDENRFRVLLYCYSNQNVPGLIKYWSSLTRISSRQFSKPYIRQDYKPEKIGKMPYGLVHIRYKDKKLFNLVMSWIVELKK